MENPIKLDDLGGPLFLGWHLTPNLCLFLKQGHESGHPPRVAMRRVSRRPRVVANECHDLATKWEKLVHLGVSKYRGIYPKMDGLQWKTLLKWMIWGYPYFWVDTHFWLGQNSHKNWKQQRFIGEEDNIKQDSLHLKDLPQHILANKNSSKASRTKRLCPPRNGSFGSVAIGCFSESKQGCFEIHCAF